MSTLQEIEKSLLECKGLTEYSYNAAKDCFLQSETAHFEDPVLETLLPDYLKKSSFETGILYAHAGRVFEKTGDMLVKILEKVKGLDFDCSRIEKDLEAQIEAANILILQNTPLPKYLN